MINWEIELPRGGKTCSITKETFAPGEEYYSILVMVDGQYQRFDYSKPSWKTLNKPPAMVGWWKSRQNNLGEKRLKLAPNDILLNLFDELSEQPDKGEMLYVLTLLMIRRRIFRYEKEEPDCGDLRAIFVYAIRRETTYSIKVIAMGEEKIKEVQEHLATLLYSEG